MRHRSLAIVAIILAQFASLSAVQAGGAMRVHNSSVKAQCMSEAKGKGLAGKAFHDDVVQCFQKGALTH
jgi:hypothetical protein